METTVKVIFDLTEKYKNSGFRQMFQEYKHKVRGFSTENKELNLKAGDVVLFEKDEDVDFISEIQGFDIDGHAFMLWDCYWYPIDLKKRLIKKIDILNPQG